MQNSDDEDVAKLVAQASAGDDAAFVQLWARFENRVGMQIRDQSQRLDAARVADIKQATYIAARKAVNSCERPSAFKSILYKIARRNTIDVLRQEKRRNEVALSEQRLGTDGDELSRFAIKEAVERALASLPKDWKTAVTLRDLLGYTNREAALAMGCSPPTATVCYQRGKAQMERSLKEDWGNDK